MEGRKTREGLEHHCYLPNLQKWGSQESRKKPGHIPIRHCLLSVAILRRLEKYLSEIIGVYQCCFMKSKSTTDHILFTLRQVMEKF